MGIRLLAELECDMCSTKAQVTASVESKPEIEEIRIIPDLPPGWDEGLVFYGVSYRCPKCQ